MGRRAFWPLRVELTEGERLAPDPYNYMTFGDIYRMQGNKAAGIAAYTRYIELQPDDPMRELAELYLTMLGGTPPAKATPPAPEPASAAPTPE
jgi:hypothetical protein